LSTLSSASGKEGYLNFLLNFYPLSAEGEERFAHEVPRGE
jgi:hypothetical protein